MDPSTFLSTFDWDQLANWNPQSNDDIAPQSHEISQTFVYSGNPHHTNVGKQQSYIFVSFKQITRGLFSEYYGTYKHDNFPNIKAFFLVVSMYSSWLVFMNTWKNKQTNKQTKQKHTTTNLGGSI